MRGPFLICPKTPEPPPTAKRNIFGQRYSHILLWNLESLQNTTTAIYVASAGDCTIFDVHLSEWNIGFIQVFRRFWRRRVE